MGFPGKGSPPLKGLPGRMDEEEYMEWVRRASGKHRMHVITPMSKGGPPFQLKASHGKGGWPKGAAMPPWGFVHPGAGWPGVAYPQAPMKGDMAAIYHRMRAME